MDNNIYYDNSFNNVDNSRITSFNSEHSLFLIRNYKFTKRI